MLNKIKYTIKQSFIYSIGNISSKLSGFVLLPLYTKYIPIERFGLLALFEITFEFLIAIANFGLNQALIRWYWDKELKLKQKSLFFTVYLFSVITYSFFIFVVLVLLYNFSFYIFEIDVSKNLIRLFILSCFARLLIAPILLLLRIQHKAIKQTSYQIFILIITVLLTVYFIIFKKMDIEGIFLAQLIGNSIGIITLIPYLIKNIKLKFELRILSEMLHFSFPLAISNLLTLILVLSDRYIIKYFGNLSDVGNYSLAFKISNIIKIFAITSFMHSYVHIFYKNMDQPNSKRFFAKSVTYFTFGLLIVGSFLSLFSKEIVKTLALNKDYWQSFEIIPLLILGIIFGGLRRMLSLILSKNKKTKIISIIVVLSGILNILLNFLIIPKFGSIGAAFTTFVSQFAVVISFYFFIQKFDRINFEVLKFVKMFSTILIISFTSILINDYEIFVRLPIKLFLFVSFPFILYFLKFYDEIELARIKGAFNKWKNISNLRENLKAIKLR